MKSIPNTSDLDEGSDLSDLSTYSVELNSGVDDNIEAKKNVRKSKIEVTIPMKGSATSTRSSRSSGSSPPDESLLYETPGTSAIATPAESVVKGQAGTRGNSTKRKREAPYTLQHDMSRTLAQTRQEKEDADLAGALQAAEYGEIDQDSDDDAVQPSQRTKVRKVSG